MSVGSALPPELRALVEAWIADDVDDAAGAELRALIDADDTDALADRFSGPLTFGTAGLRGPMRAGPNGMNRTVVRRTAAGIAAWLGARNPGSTVVIGYEPLDDAETFAGHLSAGRDQPRPSDDLVGGGFTTDDFGIDDVAAQ